MPAASIPDAVWQQFIRFSMVGCIGFVVDATVLYLVMVQLDFGLYGGRVISYLCAATSTWALNRRYTFFGQRRAGRVGEWGRFLLVNAAGGLINFAAYAVVVTTFVVAAAHPVIGVAVGSVAGLLFNFSASRYFVYRNS